MNVQRACRYCPTVTADSDRLAPSLLRLRGCVRPDHRAAQTPDAGGLARMLGSLLLNILGLILLLIGLVSQSWGRVRTVDGSGGGGGGGGGGGRPDYMWFGLWSACTHETDDMAITNPLNEDICPELADKDDLLKTFGVRRGDGLC